MGRNKSFIKIYGERIIDRTVAIFNQLFDDVLLVTNTPLDYLDLDVRIVTDLIPGKFLDSKVIAYFLSLAETADIVVQRSEGYWEPLHAVYSRKFIKSIERLMEQGDLQIIKAYKWVKVREVKREELEPLDPGLQSLLNINTPEDLERIRETHRD